MTYCRVYGNLSVEHLTGRGLISDCSVNSFPMLVYEIFLKVKLEYSVQSMTEIK